MVKINGNIVKLCKKNSEQLVVFTKKRKFAFDLSFFSILTTQTQFSDYVKR